LGRQNQGISSNPPALNFLELRRLRQDLRANRGLKLASTLLVIFRICNFAHANAWYVRYPLYVIFWPLQLIFIRLWLNCELPLGSNIGGGLNIPHPFNILLHPDATIGENCQIFHDVSIGMAYPKSTKAPRIGNNVIIGMKSSIIGAVEVPDNAIVKAHSLVYKT